MPLLAKPLTVMPSAEVHVTLKPALFDAQGATIQKALRQLGHTSVQNVRIGKYITIEIDGGDPAALQGQLDLMCQQLLANPVIEDYEITIAGVEATPVVTAPVITARDAEIAAAQGTPLPVNAKVETEAVITSRQAGGSAVAASVAPAVEPVATPGGVTDPFRVDFRSYESMATEAKLALRTLALRKHGSWIESELRSRGAAWILCVGHEVVDSGVGLDTYPSDQQLLKIGVQYDLVPWVFTRPQA